MENKEILDPLKDGISSIELVRASGSDLDVVNAARVSAGKRIFKMEDRDKKLIRYLIEHNHTSPLEHNQLVYRIKTPIYIQREWMRHRIGVSYNEISGRYGKLPREFYMPKQWRIQDPNNKQSSVPADIERKEDVIKMYTKSLDQASISYQEMLDAGVCRELARGVLPVCLYTQFIFTCNLVSLFHFVKLRADTASQWEIQQYAKGILKLARPSFPVSITAWQELKCPFKIEPKPPIYLENSIQI
jgi:thymidylate synthase (FAD)